LEYKTMEAAMTKTFELKNILLLVVLLLPASLYAGGKETAKPSVPFGEFDAPVHDSVVRGSIPVRGWALDDTGVVSVKIYHGSSRELIYIGDAMCVEGARPDVAVSYPDFPNRTRAGWGFMLLTHLLPNGGNGVFTLHAAATDSEGNQVILGAKTVHCDNANGVAPFGSIDVPGPGEVAFGGRCVNRGWALTPRPNTIPIDGSGIKVWVNGVALGHPEYNKYHRDIASLFPGYANSNGAMGFLYIDTRVYNNGVHTIQWTVTDSAGHGAIIGSRYFLVENRGTGQRPAPVQIPGKTRKNEDPVIVKKGFDKKGRSDLAYPDEAGKIPIEMEELQRLELRFFPADRGSRELMVLGVLPVGSALDARRGIFYWMPGVGFVGRYRLVFGVKEPDGALNRQEVVVNILPLRFRGRQEYNINDRINNRK
jgi:hypothetical protein